MRRFWLLAAFPMLACTGGELPPGGQPPPSSESDAAPPVSDGGWPQSVDADLPGRPDGAVGTTCQTLDVSPAEACGMTLTARVQACSIDAATGNPSQNGWLEIRRPDGSKGYLCADQWTAKGGFYFLADRQHLYASSSECCGGPPSTPAAPVTDPYLGTLHGPTHVKPQEMLDDHGSDLRQAPFAVIVSSASAAATYSQQLTTWKSWAGDGQAHLAPDGSGPYYFPSPLLINYVVIPTTSGPPMIVIGPEVSEDPAFDRPLGHPTLGACDGHGGTAMAFVGGTINQGLITNASGRFGHETSVDAEVLANVKKLFDCYGIPVTGVDYSPPSN